MRECIGHESHYFFYFPWQLFSSAKREHETIINITVKAYSKYTESARERRIFHNTHPWSNFMKKGLQVVPNEILRKLKPERSRVRSIHKTKMAINFNYQKVTRNIYVSHVRCSRVVHWTGTARATTIMSFKKRVICSQEMCSV